MTAGEIKILVYQFTSDALRGQAGLERMAKLVGATKAGDLKGLEAQMLRLADSLDKKRATFKQRGAPCSK